MNENCCNSCKPQLPGVPIKINNRPGLSAVGYRIGEYGDFLQGLQTRLSLHKNLKGLAVRDTTDYSIALTDAWSVLADVFTFYQERIINESYLRTATERFSILELARLVGYELRPGVAAGTYIAFTLEQPQATFDAKLPTVHATNLYGGSLPITIDKGIKIQSIPEKDQLPQTFETTTPVEARIEWNEIRPQSELPQEPLDETVIYIKGTNSQIKKGDVLLLRKPSGNKLKTVHEVLTNNVAGTTRLNLASVVVNPAPAYLGVYIVPLITNYLAPVSFNNSISQQIIQSSFYAKDLKMITQVNQWTELELKAGLNKTTEPPQNTEVYIFRKKVAVFGYNAQKNTSITNGTTTQTNYSLNESDGILQLDSAYDEILSDGFIAIQNPENTTNTISYYKIKSAVTGVLTRYGISSKTTTLEIQPADESSKIKWWGNNNSLDSIRRASILAQSEKLVLATVPDHSAVSGDTIVLDKYYPGLREKQPISISGEKKDLPGILYSEIAFIKQVLVEGGKTVLKLVEALQYSYIRSSVIINANVAPATHGETTQEILGSGDASMPFQKFILKQPPLTYVSASTASGISSTLEIRVNEVLWQETEFFIDRGPDEHVYMTRRDNEGNTTVIFGDGINGARLPSGPNNVVATYRKGIGSPGTLKAKQLSQLVTKPMQVKSAINPVMTSGTEEPETIEIARKNASLTILTLDRIVSLKDYEDFTTAFAGIAKAHATWARRQKQQQVFITVAGEGGAIINPNTALYKNLASAISKAGTNYVPFHITSYTPRYFSVSAGLMIHPDYISENVLENAAQRLLQQFSFEYRNFMQPVTFSEVIACLQETPGAVAVDIDALHRSEDAMPSIQYFMDASLPTINTSNFTGAELLTIAPNAISLKPIL